MNPYATVGDLVERHSIWLPRPKEWRLIPSPKVGQINGLPNLRGMALATNGIMVALETSAGSIVLGHLGWFIADDKEPLVVDNEQPIAKRQPNISQFDFLFA